MKFSEKNIAQDIQADAEDVIFQLQKYINEAPDLPDDLKQELKNEIKKAKQNIVKVTKMKSK